MKIECHTCLFWRSSITLSDMNNYISGWCKRYPRSEVTAVCHWCAEWHSKKDGKKISQNELQIKLMATETYEPLEVIIETDGVS
jgi:hypothetical protein